MRMAPRRSGNQTPPPPVWRLLLIAVSVTVLTVLVVFVIAILRYDELIAYAQAANPSATHVAILAQIWSRLVLGFVLAVSWPLTLRQLSRGSTKVYARCRQFAAIAAVVLLAITLFGSGPTWQHIAHAVLAAAEVGLFATAMHPQLRAWYTTHRPAKQKR